MAREISNSASLRPADLCVSLPPYPQEQSKPPLKTPCVPRAASCAAPLPPYIVKRAAKTKGKRAKVT